MRMRIYLDKANQTCRGTLLSAMIYGFLFLRFVDTSSSGLGATILLILRPRKARNRHKGNTSRIRSGGGFAAGLSGSKVGTRGRIRLYVAWSGCKWCWPASRSPRSVRRGASRGSVLPNGEKSVLSRLGCFLKSSEVFASGEPTRV